MSMVDEEHVFQLTIRVDDVPETETFHAVVASNAATLDEFEVERYGGGLEMGGAIGQICTLVGAVTMTATALRQLRTALNEITAAMTDIPDECVSVEIGGEVVPISAVTDEMLTDLLAS